MEGEGTVYQTGSRATRGLTLLVTDETGRPVPNVAVSFHLPEDGPSGVFTSGSRTEIVTTSTDGKASVWGMRWNRTPGNVELKITAVKDGVRAGIISLQHLTDSVASGPGPAGKFSRGGHGKLLWISLAVAGAAAGGLAMSMRHSSPAPVASTPALTIGTPTIIIGGNR